MKTESEPKRTLQTLRSFLQKKDWTPGKKDIDLFTEFWTDLGDDEKDLGTKVLAKVDSSALKKLQAKWPHLSSRIRGDWARSLGRAVFKNQSIDGHEWLVSHGLVDEDSRVRKGFLQAVGAAFQDESLKKGRQELVNAVLAVADQPNISTSERAALTKALSKSKDRRAVSLLKNSSVIGAREQLILQRDLARSSESVDLSIKAKVLLDQAESGLIVYFVPGVELLAERLGLYKGSESAGRGVLRLGKVASGAFLKNRLWLEFGVILGTLPKVNDAAKMAGLVSRAMAPLIKSIEGLGPTDPLRLRVDGQSFEGGRSEVWKFAEALAARDARVICDGRDAHFEMRIVQNKWVVAVPKRLRDERWSWRASDLPGSSQGTVAAAIALMAAPKSNEKIWDPFCGAGTELVEAHILTQGKASLFGTDIDSKALKLAENALEQANVNATLLKQDALTMKDRFDVLLTNPPFGIRTQRGTARELLESFFATVKSRVVPGGRFVLLSPAPGATNQWGEQQGLKLVDRVTIRLGGMKCELQRFEY